MEPIKINVQVNFAADKSLVDLITVVAGRHLQPAPTAAAQETKPEKPAKKAAKPETKPAAEEKAEQPKPEAETTEQPTEEPVEQPAPTDAAPAAGKEYTAVDVRAAMDRARKRIEGEDYKETPDSEGYKTWHRVLTAWFKNTAAAHGAEKPSTLPTSDKRAAFIKECDALFVKDGELTQDLPF